MMTLGDVMLRPIDANLERDVIAAFKAIWPDEADPNAVWPDKEPYAVIDVKTCPRCGEDFMYRRTDYRVKFGAPRYCIKCVKR